MDEYIKDSGVFKMEYGNCIKNAIQEKNNILKSKQRIFHMKIEKSFEYGSKFYYICTDKHFELSRNLNSKYSDKGKHQKLNFNTEFPEAYD